MIEYHIRYIMIFAEAERVFRLRLKNMLPTNLRGDHYFIQIAILVGPRFKCPSLLVTSPFWPY